MNPFTDKYFSKTKIVCEKADINPIVKYRIFMRQDGIAALEPMKTLVQAFAPNAEVLTLSKGTPFKANETIAIISGRLQELVEVETMALQWVALPCYTALESKKITELAGDKMVSNFSARHLYDASSVALAAYGAEVGGIKTHSTDIGADPLSYLQSLAITLSSTLTGLNAIEDMPDTGRGIGTTPHALVAAFGGDYIAMADAYRDALPEEKFIALIDYNNKEIDDSILLLKHLGKHLAGVRIDTCGENYAQVGYDIDGSFKYADEPGVCPSAVKALRNALDAHDGKHVKIFVSSGFNVEKVAKFMEVCPRAFDGIGTGSFIPKAPTATADIYKVDGMVETKKGREWGIEANELFYERIKNEVNS
jgi:nicotinate phosphoribosyltransferase